MSDSETLPTEEYVCLEKTTSHDDIPLPLPKSESITIKKPQDDQLYLIIKDGSVMCFCPSMTDTLRMMRFYESRVKSQCLKIGYDRVFSEVKGSSINIYERSSNFLISYDRLVSSIKFVKVNHFRSQMLIERQLDRRS